MKKCEKISGSSVDNDWEKKVDGEDDRFDLKDGKLFKLDFSTADEPGDTVLAFRVCGKVVKLSRCDFIQLIFLIITIIFILFVILASIFNF